MTLLLKLSFFIVCLSLYGSALWKVSTPELCSLEVAFNNIILRKIWSLPCQCHTAILHIVSSLCSLYNIVINCSMKVISMANKSSSSLLVGVFSESLLLSFTSFEYNSLNGQQHWRNYKDADQLCANFVRDVRPSPLVNTDLEMEII